MSAQLDETSLGEVNHGELWMEKLRCKICCSVYTHPLVLHCAHTFCLQCIAKSCKSNYQDDIDCPVCRSKVQFPRGVLSKLPKNHLLLDLMESVGLKDRCLNQKQIHTILTDTKQRRHPTRLPGSSEEILSCEEETSNEVIILSSCEEETSNEDCSEESDISSSSEDESDDSDSSNTETGTISEEYTVDSG